MTNVRSIDLATAPVDSGSITARADSIITLAGGGSAAVVADEGLRLTVDAASGSQAWLQTPERYGNPEWIGTTFALLLAGTTAGRKYEFGFIDTGGIGAFIRILDGGVRLVVARDGLTTELASVVSKTIDLSRVHRWDIKITARREAEFWVDGESLGTLEATTAVLTELLALRAGILVNNPEALTGSANVDIHWWSIDAAQQQPRRKLNAAKANVLVIKAEGGYLYDVHTITDSGSARFVMVFDKATAPENGDAPCCREYISAGQKSLPIHFEEDGRPMRFAKGISLALSTTIDTLTLPDDAEGWFDAGYT